MDSSVTLYCVQDRFTHELYYDYEGKKYTLEEELKQTTEHFYRSVQLSGVTLTTLPLIVRLIENRINLNHLYITSKIYKQDGKIIKQYTLHFEEQTTPMPTPTPTPTPTPIVTAVTQTPKLTSLTKTRQEFLTRQKNRIKYNIN